MGGEAGGEGGSLPGKCSGVSGGQGDSVPLVRLYISCRSSTMRNLETLSKTGPCKSKSPCLETEGGGVMALGSDGLDHIQEVL